MASAQLAKRHNTTVLRDLEVGDMVEFPRGLYSHWGLYIGDGQIIHLSGHGDESDGINDYNSTHLFTICGKYFDKAIVKIDNFFDVCGESLAKKNNNKDAKFGRPTDVEEVVERAMSKIGEIGYNVIWKNCEHFASFCRYGREHSEQVANAATGVMIAGTAGVAAAFLYSYLKSKKE